VPHYTNIKQKNVINYTQVISRCEFKLALTLIVVIA
jgi:hypothetical protein